MDALGIALVKNEEDIIETFVRWNLKFLDGFVIADNGSTDGTKDILNALMREGLPICLVEDDEPAQLQSEKTTNLLHRAGAIFPVEFIIPIDADELIECNNRDEFRSMLNAIPQGCSGSWQWKTYVLSPEILNPPPDKTSSLCAFRYHRKIESPQYKKTIIRVNDQNVFDLVVPKGNHTLVSSENIKIIGIDIPLAHFPVRSREQVLKKTILRVMEKTYEKQVHKSFDKSGGYQFGVILDHILRGEEFSDDLLMNLSLNYAQIPGGKSWPDNVVESPNPSFKVDTHYDDLIQGNDLILDLRRNQSNMYSEKVQTFDLSEQFEVDGFTGTAPDSTAFASDWFTDNIYLDIPPFRYLYERFLPDNILDLGCGLGKYSRLLQNFGVDRVIGVDDISPNRLFIPSGNYKKHDLTQPLDLKEKFNLVICFEVAEHLKMGSEDILLDTIEDHADGLILFSAGAPGQPGIGHVNCQPLDYWAEKWLERKWAPHIFETLCFRTLSSFSWGRGNPLILFKTNDPSECEKLWAEFKLIHRRDFLYYHKPYKIISNPLLEPIPAPESSEEKEAKKGRINSMLELIKKGKKSGKLRGFYKKISKLPKKLSRVTKRLLQRLGLNDNKDEHLLVKSSVYFDEKFFSRINPDVLQINIDPALQYLLYDGFEGSDPSELLDSSWYLEAYPDVRNVKFNRLAKFLKFAKFEKRKFFKKNVHDIYDLTTLVNLDYLNEPDRITSQSQSNDQLLYFTSTSLSADDRTLVFMSDRAGSPNLFKFDLESDQEQKVTNNRDGYLKSYVYFDGAEKKGLGKASVSFNSKRGEIFYLQGNHVVKISPEGVSKVLAEIPADQVSAFTHVSNDGNYLCVPTTDKRALDGKFNKNNFPKYDIDKRVQRENLNSYLRVFDTRSGQQVLSERVPQAWITHVQFCPTNPNLILYNHEWPGDCGIRRMWLWDGENHIRLRTEGNGRKSQDWVSHEVWEPEGEAVIYHGGFEDGRNFIGRIEMTDSLAGEPVEIPICPSYTQYGHFSVHPNNRLMVTDGYFSLTESRLKILRTTNPLFYDAYRSVKDQKANQWGGVWISLLEPDWQTKIIRWIPLCMHGSNWDSQDSHPHPIFSHNGEKVFFTSNKDGRRSIYSVEIPREFLG